MTVSCAREIPMGHRLSRHRGRCRFLHGHNYLVTLTVSGEVKGGDDSDRGMVMDFAVLKATLDSVLREYDHAFALEEGDPAIAAVGEFSRLRVLPEPPTAEVLCRTWLEQARHLLGATIPPETVSMSVFETRDCEVRS